MYKLAWNRNLHTRWSSILEHKSNIIVTERENYLCNVNADNGKKKWEVKVHSAYGWLTSFDNTIYYLERDGFLKEIDFQTGEVYQEHQFNYSFLGYIKVNEEYLITGGWRAYTNLMCFYKNNKGTFTLHWTKKTKSYSIPKFYQDSIIILNKTDEKISSIGLKTGKTIWTKKLPDRIGNLDLGYSFDILGDKIVMYSINGIIYSLNLATLNWETEVTHTCGINTIQPKILSTQYLFQDAQNFICSYGIKDKKLRWKIYSNHQNRILPAIEFDDGNTLMGFNMGRKKVIDKEGSIIQELGAERRFASDFIQINKDIFYLTKSELRKIKKK